MRGARRVGLGQNGLCGNGRPKHARHSRKVTVNSEKGDLRQREGRAGKGITLHLYLTLVHELLTLCQARFKNRNRHSTPEEQKKRRGKEEQENA